jgi:hypothetical protein
MRALIAAVVVLGLTTVAAAQWIHYPTAGLPRKADGTPDLTGPAPRMADGKPDLSGIWRGNPRRCVSAEGQSVPCGVEIGGSALMGNLGRNLPGGLPYQPWAADLARKRRADFSRDDPHVRCMPDSPPRTWTLPHLTKIIHTPKLLVTLYEVNAQYRQIFLDGRPFPEDPTPAWEGYSVGHWDGDTMVIETTNYSDKTAWRGSSEHLKVTERLTMTSPTTIRYQFTVRDDSTWTRPWSGEYEMTRIDGPLFEYACHEGNYQLPSILKGARRAEASARPN